MTNQDPNYTRKPFCRPSNGGDAAAWLQWLLHTSSDMTPSPELRNAIQVVLDRLGIAIALAQRALAVAYSIHNNPDAPLDAQILASINTKLAKLVELDALTPIEPLPPADPAIPCRPGCPLHQHEPPATSNDNSAELEPQ